MNLEPDEPGGGKEDTKPILISAVVTHLGELGPDTISLVERLTSVAGKQFCARSPHTRGLTKARVTAAFRSNLGSKTLYWRPTQEDLARR